MITIAKLKEYGANIDEGLARCLNNEDFYLRLVNKAIDDNKPMMLKQELANKNYQGAFEIAHSLKGVYGNLSLTPLFNIICEIVEPLRIKADVDYDKFIAILDDRIEKIKALRD